MNTSMPESNIGIFLRWMVAVLSLALLAACAGAPPEPVVPEPSPTDPASAFAEGRYGDAARAWQEMAIAAPPAEAGSFRIDAANAWLLDNQESLAEDSLRWVDPDALTADDRARFHLLQADIAIRQDRPGDAEALLLQVGPQLPPGWAERYRQIAANVARLLARPGSRDLAQARDLLDELDTYRPDRAVELLRTLEQIPSGELAWRAENPRSDRTLTGWLDLALIIRNHLVDPTALEPAIDAWKGRNAFHPLSRAQALDLWLRYRSEFRRPSRVAVLLPGSGRFDAAGKAIRDGIVAAYTHAPEGSELVFVATGDDPLQAASAYFEAREEGARWIIGPLQPESVEALLGLAALTTPVLALNTVPEGYLPPVGLQGQIYGVSLSQEEEVRSIAREALANGLGRALVLAPENPWGDRMAQVFREEFLQGSSEIVASARYLESENDHSAVLERLLRIDESKARAQAVENTLQMSINYEPVRRDDADMIFLAAAPVQGRQLRPQLRFHFAGNLPVYAAGRIYTGIADRTRDQDLDGIRFPITPLQLEAGASQSLPDFASLRRGSFAGLFALGHDAWSVLPWLEIMRRDPDFRFRGASGIYRVTPQGNLAREPAFAEFRGGQPVPAERTRNGLASR